MWAWLRELQEIIDTRWEQRNRCVTCELLERELAAERREKQQLLQRLINPLPTPEVSNDSDEPKPILMARKPWRVKQQELEMQDRAQKDRILREFKEKVKGASSSITDELEKSIGIK